MAVTPTRVGRANKQLITGVSRHRFQAEDSFESFQLKVISLARLGNSNNGLLFLTFPDFLQRNTLPDLDRPAMTILRFSHKADEIVNIL